MKLSWHRSSAPFIGRIVSFVVVFSLVGAAIVYGYLSPDDRIDTSLSRTTTTISESTTTSSGAGARPEVVAAEDIKSIGPAQSSNNSDTSTTTSTTSQDRAKSSNSKPATSTTTTSPPPVPQTEPQPSLGITQLVLIDARTGRALMTLTNGSVIRRSEFPTASLSVEAYATSITESVVFSVDGTPRRLEDQPPYELNGKTRWLQQPGNHTLTAHAYSRDSAQGTVSAPYTIQLTVE